MNLKNPRVLTEQQRRYRDALMLIEEAHCNEGEGSRQHHNAIAHAQEIRKELRDDRTP